MWGYPVLLFRIFYMYSYTFVCTYLYVHVHIHIHIHIHMLHIHIHIHKHIHICIYAYAYAYTYIYTYIYIYYIYTRKPLSSRREEQQIGKQEFAHLQMKWARSGLWLQNRRIRLCFMSAMPASCRAMHCNVFCAVQC